jgi:hypothetical protein
MAARFQETPTGTDLLKEPEITSHDVALYAHVSSANQKTDLDRQIARLLRSLKINRAHRYELDRNREQRTLLAKHAGAARFAHNGAWLGAWSCTRRRARVRTPSSHTGSGED